MKKNEAVVNTGRKNLNVTIAARFAADEAQEVRRIAQVRGISASDFIREAVTAYVAVESRGARSNRNVTQEYSPRSTFDMPRPWAQTSPDFQSGSRGPVGSLAGTM